MRRYLRILPPKASGSIKPLPGWDVPIMTMLPIEARTSEPATATMAANITDGLTDGLSKIGDISVKAPHTAPPIAAAAPSKAEIRGSRLRNHSPGRLVEFRIYSPLDQVVERSRGLPSHQGYPSASDNDRGGNRLQCSLTAAPSLIRLSERVAVSRRRQ